MAPTAPLATARSLDHLVLTVSDLDAAVAWYTRNLGMRHTAFSANGTTRHALAFGTQKINLHVAGAEFEPKARHVRPGCADLCFLVDEDVADVLARFAQPGGPVLEGRDVVARTGATGKLRSIYVRDEDENLIE